MRTKSKTTRIRISDELHADLTTDKKHFQKVIGGGIWSFDDTIREYRKIIMQYQK